MVYVNDSPSTVYGNNDHGLGLCRYIAPGSLPRDNAKQSPYQITNYDNNLGSTPGQVNFIQIDTTNQPTLEFSVTGNEEFGEEYFGVYCSGIKGVMGTKTKVLSTFNSWLSLNLPSTCTYVSFTPYTHTLGAPSTYCVHTAILVNVRVPCAGAARKRTMLRA